MDDTMDEIDAGDQINEIVAALNLSPSQDEQNWTADGQDGQFSHSREGSSTAAPVTPGSSSFRSGGHSRSASSAFEGSPVRTRSGVSPTHSTSPLVSFASSSTNQRRPTTPFIDSDMGTLNERLFPQAEKDVDNPNTPSTPPGRRSVPENQDYTPTTLSRLLGGNVAISPGVSRQASYSCGNANLIKSPLTSESSSLPDHLYTRGLLGGKHSDIDVMAFGQKYNLHRIILDRAPFFANALSEPWSESTSREISLHPEDVDAYITQTAFEMALKRLYGCDISEEEDAEAINLLATGCWLEMSDLVDSAIDSILRQMTPELLPSIIRLVTNNCYGPSGERILASAKAMLCRDGWEMPLRIWDGISGEIIREIVGGDGFFIHNEWERWNLARRLVDRRLKQVATDIGIVATGSRAKIKAPNTLGHDLYRFNPAAPRPNPLTAASESNTTIREKWLLVYTHPDIEPLLVLLDEGIYYMHLEFEQLQQIRRTLDVFGLPMVPEVVVFNALYMQMELRQKVLNASSSDLELGLSQSAQGESRARVLTNNTISTSSEFTASPKASTSNPIIAESSERLDIERDGLDFEEQESEPARTRRFWIPGADCNIVMGGNSASMMTSNASPAVLRLSSTLDPSEVQWTTGFASSPSNNIDSSNRSITPNQGSASANEIGEQSPSRSPAYTHFPPFRFAVEFPAARSLREKKRVYSRNVFYAGSYWNIYIQKIAARNLKNLQLGVYLHRVRERDTDDNTLSSGGVGNSSVDEKIGILERDILLRSEQRLGMRARRAARARGDMTSSFRSSTRSNTTLDPPDSTQSSRTLFSRHNSTPSTYGDAGMQSYISLDTDSSDDSNDSTHLPNPGSDSAINTSRLPRIPALPPYVDNRPTIKTYFKIYSPSKAGRLLSVYESAPDQFDFSQSWGWRSSTLMLDEGFLNETAEDGIDGRKSPGSILRFMVVIGNL